jgi:hypothetical protein
MSIYIKNKVEVEENLMEVHKVENNEWIDMSSFSLIVSYFILHTLPLFRLLKH